VLLNGDTIPASAIGLPTNGARVTSAQFIPASASGGVVVAEHCRVIGAIRPVDPAAPDIRFGVALPSEWNGRTLMLGGGGFDGVIPNLTGPQPVAPADRPAPMSRG
jgi:feruloyl esterase